MKNDKTKTYSDQDKTHIYSDEIKRTKESVHNIKAGDQIVLNNNEYNVIEIISESTGEAVIYKIEDRTNKIFALKLYFEFHDPNQEPNTEALERIKSINDPDILNLIDYGTGTNKYEGKYCFELLNYAHGLDLLDVDDLKIKYTPEFLEKKVIPEIFKGILKLHENKIYHCDLKPRNVFFLDKEQNDIVVGDYGSAKTFDYDAEKSSRKTTTVKGTDFYLPPEQARGFISEKNDYYSFGMILLHLLYPEKLLTDDGKNISRLKFKQIIERQFEAKPIIDYDPKFKRINTLIEGLTLADFNLRWGSKEVKQWSEGESVEVSYRGIERRKDDDVYAKRSLIFGKHRIQSVYDVRDYILQEKEWYENLIEDEDNREEFTAWFLELYDGDRSKRSAFNRIVKDYSPDGKYFVGEAIIHFFIPHHPVTVGAKTFNLAESVDIFKSAGEVFTHILFDCWDGSKDEDLKRYIFNFEFALRYTKDDSGAEQILKKLYKVLSVKEIDFIDFEDYAVHAYRYINKNSKDKIKEFLTDILANDISFKPLSLDKNFNLKYHLLKTASSFFKEIGSSHTLSLEFKDIHQITLSKVRKYNDLNDFINKLFDDLFNKFSKKHKLSEETAQASKAQIKEDLIKFFSGLSDKILEELSKYLKFYTINVFEIEGSIFTVTNAKVVPQQLNYNDIPLINEQLIKYKEKYNNIQQIKENVKKDIDFYRKSSQLQELLDEIEVFSFSGNFNEIDHLYNNIHRKRNYKVSELVDLTDQGKHQTLAYGSIDGYEQINVNSMIGSIAVSGNGEKIVAATNFLNKQLFVIDAKKRRLIRTIDNLKFSAENISVCQVGKFVACTGTHDKEVLVYNLNTGKRDTVLRRGGGHYATSAVFSPDNKYLAVSSYDDTVVKRYASWKTLKIYDTSTPISFHPLEDYLANIEYPNSIQLINLHNNERLLISERHENDIEEMCFSPDGTMIAAHGGDHMINIWNVRTAEIIQSLRGHAQYSETYHSFSPDGKTLVSLMNSGEIRLWNPKTGQAIISIEGFDSVEGICFHPSGEYLIIADRYQVTFIPIKRKKVFNQTMSFSEYVNKRLKPVTEEKKAETIQEETEDKDDPNKLSDIASESGSETEYTETILITTEDGEIRTELLSSEPRRERSVRRELSEDQILRRRRRRIIFLIVFVILWILASIFIVDIIDFFQDPASNMKKLWYNSVKSNMGYTIKTANQSGNELVYINAGSFRMGLNKGYKGEYPAHKVILPGFYIGKYEVSNTQFCNFLNEYKSIKIKSGIYKGEDILGDDPINNPGIRKIRGVWTPLDGFENKPVVEITWYGANEYCKFYGGRLPTEAEWEFAAKGGNQSGGFEYAGSDNLDEISSIKEKNTSISVGQKKANEAGLYDMTGNVWEWCEDTYDEDYYKISPLFDPCYERNMKTIYGRTGLKNLTHNEWRYYRTGSTVDNITMKVIRGSSNKSGSYHANIERREKFEKFRAKDDLGFRICFNDTLNDEKKQYIEVNKELSDKIEREKEERRSKFQFIYIQGDKFEMGDSYIYRTDRRVHDVTLDSYFISNREITNEQYCLFLNLYGSKTVKSGEYEGKLMIKPDNKYIKKQNNQWIATYEYKNMPVINVSWYGANAFCNYFGGRLPTEAEWEFAARSGVDSRDYPYPGGGNPDELAWYSRNSAYKIQQVATKKPNRLGIYDMAGNIREWCLDTYEYNYYRNSPKKNPCNYEYGKYKVVRGGSYSDSKSNLSPFERGKLIPGTFSQNTGFRIIFKKSSLHTADTNLLKAQRKNNTSLKNQEKQIENNTGEKSAQRKVKFQMVLVEGGTFMMGDSSGRDNENFVHKVSLNSFYISNCEITNSQYCEFLNDIGYDDKDYATGRNFTMIKMSNKFRGSNWGIVKSGNKWKPAKGYDDYPVVFVSRYGAHSYCVWAGGRLPTEAEWEYAARGGNKSKQYDYPGNNSLSPIAWYNANSKKKTHIVGSKQANELGLYDMAGNVWEWCLDAYKEKFYKKSPEMNPLNTVADYYSSSARGGSFNSDPSLCLIYRRSAFNTAAGHHSDVGFRMAKDVK